MSTSKNEKSDIGADLFAAGLVLVGIFLVAWLLLYVLAYALIILSIPFTIAYEHAKSDHLFSVSKLLKMKFWTALGLLPMALYLSIEISDYNYLDSAKEKSIVVPKLKEKQLGPNKHSPSLEKADREKLFKISDKNHQRIEYLLYAIILTLTSVPMSYFFIEGIKGVLTNKGLFNFTIRSYVSVLYFFSRIGLFPWKLFGAYKAPDADKDTIIIGNENHAYLTGNNLNYHVQIIGGSGAGKTNLLKVLIEDRVSKGHSLVFFDLKADVELMDWLTGLSTNYGRRDDLIVINMSNPSQSSAYNPIINGDETEISSQLMNSLEWSEPFYRSVAEGALLIILKAFCHRRDASGIGFHLGDLYSFMVSPDYRMKLLGDISILNFNQTSWIDLKRINEELSSKKADNYQSLIVQISKILNSTAGDIVTDRCFQEECFDFRKSIQTGKISYLFMNSLKLKETAGIMGKIMLQDLMKAVGNIYDERGVEKKPTTLIIDEFASFAMPDFGEFIEKARGAGIGIVVAYQSRKSLDHIGSSLSIKVNENTGTKIVFHTQDSDDVEWFSSLIGTKKEIAETYQAENGLFGDRRTGQKSVREVEEFIVHPNDLKNLTRGQALLYCSKVDRHYGVINIKQANEYSEVYVREPKKIATRTNNSSLKQELSYENNTDVKDLI